jgi:membrane protein YqaA with SNARE-associated domain
MFIYIIASLWGFAEATLFFIIPDVWISLIALQSGREALIACGYALVGAMLGGWIMYYRGRANVSYWNAFLDKIPAIRARDIQKVQADLTRSGITAVLFGPAQGIPYKVFAVNAHAVMSIYTFLLITIPARVIRFIIIALIASFVSERFLSGFSLSEKTWMVLGLWTISYIGYFILRRE